MDVRPDSDIKLFFSRCTDLPDFLTCNPNKDTEKENWFDFCHTSFPVFGRFLRKVE